MVEVGIFGEGHHGALDAYGFPRGEIADERSRLKIGHADAADAGVDANMERDGLLRFGGDLVQGGANGRVNHGKNVASYGVGEVLLVKRAEKKDRFANASVAKREGFVKLDDREAEDFGLRI